MLNLIFAPSADILVPLAADCIRRAWGDPFAPPAIIVPNPAVGKWLKIRLSEPQAFGCVVGARMITLERFLWEALGGGPGVDLIDAGRLSQVICAVLGEDILKNDVYAPLRNYLCESDHQPSIPDDHNQSSTQKESHDPNQSSIHRDQPSIPNNPRPLRIDALKRVQLSMKIASQFLEYEYNRPSVWDDFAGKWKLGIDAKWINGKTYFDGNGHEAWQMDLYKRVADRFRKADGLISLPHLYRKRREECAEQKRPWCDVGPNRQIILFGVSKISHFHRNTLVEISQIDGVDMHVFLTNPCAEFWEDVDTSRSTFRRKWRHDSPGDQAGIRPVKPEDYEKSDLSEIGMFANERDHKLLELWGKAGKENIFLWYPQANWNFDYVGSEEGEIERLDFDYVGSEEGEITGGGSLTV